MISSYTSNSRLYIFIYSWRSNRYSPCQLLTRCCSSWYMLCTSTFSLCIIYRSNSYYHGWICALIIIILRLYISKTWAKIYFMVIFVGINIMCSPQYFLVYQEYQDATLTSRRYITWITVSFVGSFISLTAIIIIVFMIWKYLHVNEKY